MAKDIFNFKRVETKYIITKEIKDKLYSLIQEHLIEDEYGISRITSLYLDTPNFILIRNSIDGKTYKEKLRIRSYNQINNDSKVFLEIKKKYKKVVYKRRIKCSYEDVLNYIYHGIKPVDSQIMNEIDYAMKFYKHPKPSFLISYIREAYFEKDNRNLRITFDSKVSYRRNDLDLCKQLDNKQILDNNTYIMEIKSNGGMPLWLVHALNELEIRPQSYSKYKNSYFDYLGGDYV